MDILDEIKADISASASVVAKIAIDVTTLNEKIAALSMHSVTDAQLQVVKDSSAALLASLQIVDAVTPDPVVPVVPVVA